MMVSGEEREKHLGSNKLRGRTGRTADRQQHHRPTVPQLPVVAVGIYGASPCHLFMYMI